MQKKSAHLSSSAVLFMCIFIILFSSCSGREGFYLIKNGESPYVIALANGASESERYAAEELRDHLKRAFGTELAILEGMPVPQDKVPILIGSYRSVPGDNFGQEKYSIRIAKGSKIPVINISGGKPRGTLYGVYVFLERLGFRWYTPDVTKYPGGDTLRLPYINEEGSPAFIMRYPGVHVQRLYDPTWAARNLINATISPRDRKRGGRVNVYGVHTFDRLIPRSLYKDHPEYFPLIGGKRVTGYVQRCLTNPGVVDVAANNIMDSMEKNKDDLIFSLSQGDVDKYCECPDCMKIMEEEGSPSGLYVLFVNRVAEIVEEKYPDKYISTLAYWFTQKPPKTVKPRHNVFIRLCPISMDVARPFYESNDYRSREFAQDLEGWSKLTDRIILWLYNTDFCHMLMPFPTFKGNIEAIKTYARYGVKGIYIEGNSYPDLSIWVFARLLWNPGLDPDGLIDEWMHAVYGKAYEPMRKAFDLTHEQVASPDSYLHVFDAPTRNLWPEQVVSGMDRLHEEAEKLAASDSTALYYVKKNRLRIEYLDYILNTGRLKVQDDVYAPAGNTAVVEDFDRLYEKALSFGVTSFGAGWADHKPQTLLRQRVESHPLITLENEDIRLDIVPNLGGRIVRIIDKKTGQNILKEADPETNRYPVSGGYEESTAFTWGRTGYSNPYEAKLNGHNLTLTCTNSAGLIFSRTITLQEKGTRIDFFSSIKNGSKEMQTFKLLLRMELDADPSDILLFTKDDNGLFKTAVPTEEKAYTAPDYGHIFDDAFKVAVTEENREIFEDAPERYFRFDGNNVPSGAWRLQNSKDGWILENRFEKDAVHSCHFTVSNRHNSVLMEVHTHESEVEPGGIISVRHSWELILINM